MKSTISKLVAVLGCAAALGTTATAKSDTYPAMGGRAWQPSDATCFSVASFSNAVTNGCSSGRSWLVPMSLRIAGQINFSASAKPVTLGTGPACRFVVRSANDSNVALGSNISVTSTNRFLGGATVDIDSTAHIDCFLSNGLQFPLSSVRWFLP
jgi:hypothetical protein